MSFRKKSPDLKVLDDNALLKKENDYLKKKLEVSSERFLNIVGKSMDGLVVLDQRKIIMYINYSALSLFDQNIANVLGESIDVICDLKELFNDLSLTIEFNVCKRKKVKAIVEASVVASEWGDSPCFVVRLRNITDRKKSEKMLEYMSHHDNLTKLPNRLFFEKKMEKSIIDAKEKNKHMALLYIDLDNFKMVNDTLGHDVGDMLLQEVSNILEDSTQSRGDVARLGGDEFAIILSDLSNPSYSATVARKILNKLRQTFNLDGRDVYTNASIGIAVYPFAGSDAIELTKNADSAMYNAKQKGKNQYRFHSEELSRNNEINLLIINKLRTVLDSKSMFVVYQPIIDLGTERCCGAESLLRWKDSELGMIPPDKFIPFAEESGAILDIGRFVVKQSLTDYKKLNLDSSFFVSVNMSANELDELKTTKEIQSLIKKMGMSTHQLVLELTETSVMRNPENTIKKFNALSDEGVLIAVDDFGTGYSSLAYLKQLPLFALKIDKSFIDDIGEDSSNEVIIKATIQLSYNLGFRVIAEGVEKKAQVDFLKENKCDYIQGYYYSKPLPFEEFKAYVKEVNN